jgi:cytochrome d ubiquinol oxidase subunit I
VEGPTTWKVIRTAVFLAAVLTPLQIFVGDLHGLNTLKHQPAKIAAIEGIWQTEKGAELVLLGIPDEEAKTTHLKIAVPKIASLILTHEWDGELKGLNEFEGQHPPVAATFWAFRIMVGIGIMMLIVSWWGSVAFLIKKEKNPWLLKTLSWMTFSGWIAVVAGWYVTEIGRQPWIVYGLIGTREVVADHGGGMVLSTLLLYLFMVRGSARGRCASRRRCPRSIPGAPVPQP